MKHSAGFLQLVEDAKTRISEITVEETLQCLQSNQGFHLLDVREDHEWQQGHASGAQHLSRGILERDIEHLHPDKQTPLILYCGGGYRSALACDNLQRMGYHNVHSLTGGWKAWQDSGAPTESN